MASSHSRRNAARENPSTGVWIAIGAGVAAVTGVVVYLATRPSSAAQSQLPSTQPLPPSSAQPTTQSSFAPTTAPAPQPAPVQRSPQAFNVSPGATGAPTSITMHVYDTLTITPPHPPPVAHNGPQDQWVCLELPVGLPVTQNDMSNQYVILTTGAPPDPKTVPYQVAGAMNYIARSPGQATLTLSLNLSNEHHQLSVTVVQ